jgi:hypothetical protein
LPLPLQEAAPTMAASIRIIVLPRLERATSLLLLIDKFFLQRNQVEKISINNIASRLEHIKGKYNI